MIDICKGLITVVVVIVKCARSKRTKVDKCKCREDTTLATRMTKQNAQVDGKNVQSVTSFYTTDSRIKLRYIEVGASLATR